VRGGGECKSQNQEKNLICYLKSRQGRDAGVIVYKDMFSNLVLYQRSYQCSYQCSYLIIFANGPSPETRLISPKNFIYETACYRN